MLIDSLMNKSLKTFDITAVFQQKIKNDIQLLSGSFGNNLAYIFILSF